MKKCLSGHLDVKRTIAFVYINSVTLCMKFILNSSATMKFILWEWKLYKIVSWMNECNVKWQNKSQHGCKTRLLHLNQCENDIFSFYFVNLHFYLDAYNFQNKCTLNPSLLISHFCIANTLSHIMAKLKNMFYPI